MKEESKKTFEIIRRIASDALKSSYDTSAVKSAIESIFVISTVYSEYEEKKDVPTG